MSSDAIAAMLREAIARPDDDGTRAVLADMLQAAGDPRGELMALQLLPPDDADAPAREERIQALLRAHVPGWLGWLRDVSRAATFERGLLTRLTIEPPRYGLDDPRFQSCLAAPELASVEDLIGHGACYRRFVTSPAMTSLRRIEIGDPETIEAFATTKSPITHAVWMFDGSHPFRRFLAVCAQRTTLTSLAVDESLFVQVAAMPWFEQLVSVTIAGGMRRVLALWSKLPHGMSLRITPGARLEPCSRTFWWDCQIELEAIEGGVVARISGKWLLQPVDVLAALPAEVTRVEIEEATTDIVPRIREVVARPGLDVITRPARRHGYVAL